jgi:hypothetical protein
MIEWEALQLLAAPWTAQEPSASRSARSGRNVKNLWAIAPSLEAFLPPLPQAYILHSSEPPLQPRPSRRAIAWVVAGRRMGDRTTAKNDRPCHR